MQEAQSNHGQVDSVKCSDFSVYLGLSSVICKYFDPSPLLSKARLFLLGEVTVQWYLGGTWICAHSGLVSVSCVLSHLACWLVVRLSHWCLLKQPGPTCQVHNAPHSCALSSGLQSSSRSFPGTWENLAALPAAAGIYGNLEGYPLAPVAQELCIVIGALWVYLLGLLVSQNSRWKVSTCFFYSWIS